MAIAPFWMVHGIGKRAPTKLHQTQDSAATEAYRLASIPTNRKTVFVVLEAKEGFVAENDSRVVRLAPEARDAMV